MLDKNTENANNYIQNDDGSMEFSFGDENEAAGKNAALVFEEVNEEVGTDQTEDDVFDVAAASENISAEELDEALSESPTSASDADEFIIPEQFDMPSDTEKYVSTIWKPYVPRFTDATKDKYYFADNEAADELKKTISREGAGEEAADGAPAPAAVSVVKVERGASSNAASGADFTDPTAEIESFVPAAVVVNVNGKPQDSQSTLNIFKFPDKNEIEQKTVISDEERERLEISGLTGHRWENTPDESLNELSGTSDRETGNPLEDPESDDMDTGAYDKPEFDLEAELLQGERYAYRQNEKHIPEGYDKKEKSTANDTSEYNSFSMRDTFKDKFLDSIMASSIRLGVSIILGFLAVIFDIFEDRICSYLGIQQNLRAPAVIDGCLIISLMLIVMPEIIRAIKQLARGAVVPELSVFFGGLALLGYTIAMAAVPSRRYPLFSCVYAIMVINSIFATDYLHCTHFSAFKVVSEKGNKHIIDKPYTRTMELENAALDGAVDEYKSRTASLYTTPFVSGFFKNISKNSENSKNNLIILASSFGVAVVIGVVMFFINGIVSALGAFALVISLSLPAFSILSHKLPYRNVQNRAKLEKSAVIGERALYDYSAVDVITFEDTEVFGPDDVTLKSASDRRSDYVDTMRKMASLFAALGGPLLRVFESALNKRYAPAENVVIEDDGAEGLVDGKSVLAGNADYMRRRGIKIPDADEKRAGSTRIIYAASEGEFFAAFTVHYSFSEEFALELSAMRENGIVPLVYTRDFNINNEFMQMLTGGNDVIRVMKKYTPVEEEEVYSKINSTMVTFGGKSAAINLILSSKRYLRFKSLMAITELTACLTGAALAVAIVLSNMMLSLPAAVLAVWQLGWSIALAVMSKRIFNPRKKEKDDEE